MGKNLLIKPEQRGDISDKTISSKIADTVSSVSGFLLMMYVLILILWVVLSKLGLIGYLIYKPAHFFFGEYIYLEFYLRYGFLLISLCTSPFLILAVFVCRGFKKFTPSGKNVRTDSTISSKSYSTETKKKGVIESYRDLRRDIGLLILPIAVAIGMYLFWVYVIPDFKMVQNGDYFTVEIESDRFSTRRTTQRRSFGYDYIISVPRSESGKTIAMDASPFATDSFSGYTLDASLPLYEELSAMQSAKSIRWYVMADGTIAKEIPEREYVIIQLHYLPNTRCLLGYTVIE